MEQSNWVPQSSGALAQTEAGSTCLWWIGFGGPIKGFRVLVLGFTFVGFRVVGFGV